MEDVQALLTPQPFSPTEAILCAVGDLSAKPANKSGGYRRLRYGEKQFDHWLEQGCLMVEESEGSAKDKRRIMESLKGPAL